MSFFKSEVEWQKILPKTSPEGLSYGNIFLDKALGGLFPGDLVVLTARTGSGKTELATQIAQVNARNGKRPHLFALEARIGEVGQRIKFKLLAQAFFTQKDWRTSPDVPNFQDWIRGKQKEILEKFEPEVDEIFNREYSTLKTLYRGADFNVDNFSAIMGQIETQTDVVIVDHLHYFDLDSDNENVALKKTVKKIKNIVDFSGKPAVIVAHLRKQDNRLKTLVPDIEEIHGSSDISKIATAIIATAPAYGLSCGPNAKHIFPTFFRVIKNRTDGSRCRYTALCGFDSQKNAYAQDFRLGEFSKDEFIEIDRMDYPRWAR